MNANQSEGFKQPRILRGRVDSLSIYEITDYELELLEQGSPNSIFLNFSIFLSSTSISFLTTLLTIEALSDRLFLTFTTITIAGMTIGILLATLWYKGKHKIDTTIKKIKSRNLIDTSETTAVIGISINLPTIDGS